MKNTHLIILAVTTEKYLPHIVATIENRISTIEGVCNDGVVGEGTRSVAGERTEWVTKVMQSAAADIMSIALPSEAQS